MKVFEVPLTDKDTERLFAYFKHVGGDYELVAREMLLGAIPKEFVTPPKKKLSPPPPPEVPVGLAPEAVKVVARNASSEAAA